LKLIGGEDFMKALFIVALVFLALTGCAGSSSFIDTAKLPDTYQCNYMKDVCKEAQDFEAKYESMTVEEKKEFKNLLMVYRNQCRSALDVCRKSGNK
jgi:hypothetical protein